jgi:phosphoglycerol transferase MdoB-like AlkP superfamily enzyme
MNEHNRSVERTVQHRILRGAQGLALRLLVCLLVVVLGETLFRGWHETGMWVLALPAAWVVSAFYAVLWLYALEIVLAPKWSLLLLASVFWTYSLANHAKFEKLGLPIVPTDLLLSGQYAQVVYMVWGHWSIAVLLLIFCALLLVVWWLRKRASTRRMSWTARLVGMFCLLVAILLVIEPDYNFKNARYSNSIVASQLDAWGMSNLNWNPSANVKVNGQILSFVMNAKAALILPPPGYGEDLVRDALLTGSSPMPLPSNGATSAKDIVVIMSEAWWDPTDLPGLSFTDPLLKNLDITSRGKMFSPVFGGYTANTEFEFLTRISNERFPVGSIPYVQYVDRPFDTLVTDFVTAGYRAIAMHPFDRKFWNRENVYPRLGFEKFISGEAFTYRDETPPYISDRSMAKQIIATIQEDSRPHFVFVVSVQNHGPYLDGATRYAGESRVEVVDPDHRLDSAAKDTLSSYASGVRDAVSSFNDVVAYMKKSGRPSIVVMFGDHLPFLGDDFSVYTESHFIADANQGRWNGADQERMHGVPVVAWSNLPEPLVLPSELFSPIYLGSIIKRSAGISGNSMDLLLDVLRNAFPVISQVYTKSADGKVVLGPAARTSIVTKYEAVAYDLLFGKNYAHAIISQDASGQEKGKEAPAVGAAKVH